MSEKILKLRQVPLSILLAAAMVVGLVAIVLSVAGDSVMAAQAQGIIVKINKSEQHGVIQRIDADPELDGRLYQYRIPEDCALVCPGLGETTTFVPIEAPAHRATDVGGSGGGCIPPNCGGG